MGFCVIKQSSANPMMYPHQTNPIALHLQIYDWVLLFPVVEAGSSHAPAAFAAPNRAQKSSRSRYQRSCERERSHKKRSARSTGLVREPV